MEILNNKLQEVDVGKGNNFGQFYNHNNLKS